MKRGASGPIFGPKNIKVTFWPLWDARILVPTGHVQVVTSSSWPVVRGCIFAPSFFMGAVFGPENCTYYRGEGLHDKCEVSFDSDPSEVKKNEDFPTPFISFWAWAEEHLAGPHRQAAFGLHFGKTFGRQSTSPNVSDNVKMFPLKWGGVRKLCDKSLNVKNVALVKSK